MVERQVIDKQLRAVHAESHVWGKTERDELPKIIIPGEVVKHVQRGYYSGGFATLVATTERLLLIDKKPLFLTVIDLRYDMIAEVDYGHQLFGATIHVKSFNKDFKFQRLNKHELRDITNFIQQKVVEMRSQQNGILVEQVETAPIQPIPRQVFTEDTNQITTAQAKSLLPVDQATWQRINRRRNNNPYTQLPLLTRRRVGRYDFAGRQS